MKHVLVNNQAARATAGNFAQWEVELASPGKQLPITAVAEDAAGNREPRPHVWGH